MAAPTWTMLQEMKNPAIAALVHHLWVMENDDPQREGKLITSSQVVGYQLATYAIEDVIAESEAEMTTFKQAEHTYAVRYTERFWESALNSGCSN